MQMQRTNDERRDTELRERVRLLLALIWSDNQREMARSLGLSQTLISLMLSGARRPSRRLLAALASHLKVNAAWLQSGKGRPLRDDQPTGLPVSTTILPGSPDQFSALILDAPRHPVASEYYATSRYWLALAEDAPAIREPALCLRDGDLLLVETATATIQRPELDADRLCAVRLGGDGDPEYQLGFVKSVSRQPVVRLLAGEYSRQDAYPPPSGGSSGRRNRPHGSGPRRSIRRIKTIEEVERDASQARCREDEARQRAREGLPLRWEDVLGVAVYCVRTLSVI
jgi:transcriptional regulator with XRE-family HTH domain